MKRWMLWLAVVSGCIPGLAISYGQQAERAAARVVIPAIRLTPAVRVEDSLLRYVPDDVAMIGIIQPARMLTAETLKTVVQSAKADDLFQDLLQFGIRRAGVDPSKITEAALFVDRQSLQNWLQQQKKMTENSAADNNLRTIGLAMHNFHDAYGAFPDDDGGLDDSKGNLSWRVHLLPFVGEQALYEEFHLNEPWDSEHNKSLISRMPACYQVDGVESGQTSVHVLLGEGTPFGGDEPPGMASITDGTSNTMMFVSAGTDTAEVWTKPGGLTIDPEAPAKALGNVSESVQICMMDGSVRSIPTDVTPKQWLQLARHQDGEVPEIIPTTNHGIEPVPALIVRLSDPIDQQQMITQLLGNGQPTATEISGQPATRLDPVTCVVFPTPRTMLISSEAVLTEMLAPRQASEGLRLQLEQLYPASDVVLLGSLEGTRDVLTLMLPETPFAGIFSSITQASFMLDTTGSNPSLLAIQVTTDTPQSALQINGLVTGGFQMLKGQLLNQLSQPESQIPESLTTMISEMLDSVAISTDDKNVSLQLPKLENPTQTFQGLSTEMAALAGLWRQMAAAQQDISKRNSLKQMVLAMHNYHDVHSHFPKWDGEPGENAKESEKVGGLSWRVYLLPYLDQSELFSRFHLDEPWDSEHNKTLIDQMPEIFRTEGVDAPGKTSYHVFLGEQTPLGGKGVRSMRDVVDGTSNTLMFVKAGPDQADVWTKPSGLEYVPEDPLKCLGNVGEKILVALCDGSVRDIENTVSKETFLRLIEHADGQIIEDF